MRPSASTKHVCTLMSSVYSAYLRVRCWHGRRKPNAEAESCLFTRQKNGRLATFSRSAAYICPSAEGSSTERPTSLLSGPDCLYASAP